MSIVDLRARLVDTLAEVMPDRRVFGFPPQRPAPVAPAIYVATYSAAWNDDYSWAATFDVRLVADGDTAAAHGKLDRLVDAVYAAVARSSDFYPQGLGYDPFDVDAAVTLPAYTFQVAAEISIKTWCPPDPPEPVPATTGA